MVMILKNMNYPRIIHEFFMCDSLNQIINGTISNNYYSLREPFKTKLEIHTTQTKGCDFYGPVKVRDLIDRNEIDINDLEGFDRNILNHELFFVDTEGLKSIDIVTKTCIAGILTILQISSIKILYMPTLENEKFEEVAKNSKLSNILRIFYNFSLEEKALPLFYNSETIFIIYELLDKFPEKIIGAELAALTLNLIGYPPNAQKLAENGRVKNLIERVLKNSDFELLE